MDKKAKSTIILSLSDSVIREIANEKTVAEPWATLDKLYMTKSRMFTLKMPTNPLLMTTLMNLTKSVIP